jgi:hypothetical protein
VAVGDGELRAAVGWHADATARPQCRRPLARRVLYKAPKGPRTGWSGWTWGAYQSDWISGWVWLNDLDDFTTGYSNLMILTLPRIGRGEIFVPCNWEKPPRRQIRIRPVPKCWLQGIPE